MTNNAFAARTVFARITCLLACGICSITAATAFGAPKQLLILSGSPDGHPAGTHEYAAGAKIMADLLRPGGEVSVTTVKVEGPWSEGPELLEKADGVVMFLGEGAKWVSADPRRLDALGKLAQRKAGLVALHWAIGTKPAEPIDAFQKLLGGCHGGPDRKYKFLETTFSPVAQPHAVTRGLEPIKLSDEFYYQLKFVQDAGLSPLVQVEIDGQPQTVSWAWQRPDGGRSFGFSGLHVHDNWRQPSYRRLITQGIRWTLGLDIPENGIALPDLPEEDFVLSTKAPSANP